MKYAFTILVSLIFVIETSFIKSGGQDFVLGKETYFDRLPSELRNLIRELLANDPILVACSWQQSRPLTLSGLMYPGVRAQFNSRGDKIVTYFWHEATIWDASDCSRITTLFHRNNIRVAEFNAQGDKIVTSSDDHTAKIWNISNRSCIATLSHEHSVWSAEFNAQGDKIVTAASTVKIWSVSDGSLIATIDLAALPRFNSQGNKIVTTAYGSTARGEIKFDSTAKIWALNGSCIVTLKGHEDGVLSARFNAQGDKIVTGCADGTVKIWDALDGSCIATLAGHRGKVKIAKFNAQGDKVVTADPTVKIWNVLDGSCIATLKFHDDSDKAVQFNAQGNMIVTPSYDYTAKIWDASDGSCIATLNGHIHLVSSAQFNAQGNKILTTSQDGTVKLWQRASISFKQAASLLHALNLIRRCKDFMFPLVREVVEKRNSGFFDALIEVVKECQVILDSTSFDAFCAKASEEDCKSLSDKVRTKMFGGWCSLM